MKRRITGITAVFALLLWSCPDIAVSASREVATVFGIRNTHKMNYMNKKSGERFSSLVIIADRPIKKEDCRIEVNEKKYVGNSHDLVIYLTGVKEGAGRGTEVVVTSSNFINSITLDNDKESKVFKIYVYLNTPNGQIRKSFVDFSLRPYSGVIKGYTKGMKKTRLTMIFKKKKDKKENEADEGAVAIGSVSQRLTLNQTEEPPLVNLMKSGEGDEIVLIRKQDDWGTGMMKMGQNINKAPSITAKASGPPVPDEFKLSNTGKAKKGDGNIKTGEVRRQDLPLSQDHKVAASSSLIPALSMGKLATERQKHVVGTLGIVHELAEKPQTKSVGGIIGASHELGPAPKKDIRLDFRDGPKELLPAAGVASIATVEPSPVTNQTAVVKSLLGGNDAPKIVRPATKQAVSQAVLKPFEISELLYEERQVVLNIPEWAGPEIRYVVDYYVHGNYNTTGYKTEEIDRKHFGRYYIQVPDVGADAYEVRVYFPKAKIKRGDVPEGKHLRRYPKRKDWYYFFQLDFYQGDMRIRS